MFSVFCNTEVLLSLQNCRISVWEKQNDFCYKEYCKLEKLLMCMMTVNIFIVISMKQLLQVQKLYGNVSQFIYGLIGY